nr:lipid-A-disaccharide synthase [Leptolyngbya sp. FACHB-541]
MRDDRQIRIFISTGEVSGDLQGALLVKALRDRAKQSGLNLEILALGGKRMAAAGATLLGDTSAIGSIGIFESLPYVLPTLQMQRRVKRYLRQNPPDLVVMIDYLAPNLGIGSYVKRHFPQIPVVYYIAPQEWVWSLGANKTKRVVELVDRLLAIFPEEACYYEKWGADVTWVGHPLVDRMQSTPSRSQAREALGIAPDQVAIALLPASRHQEVKYLLPVIFEAARRIQAQLPHVEFWVPLSLEAYRRPVEQAIQTYGLRATLVTEQVQTVFAAMDLAIAKSGTVNLELALLDIPQVVLYRVSPLTAWIAQNILKFKIPFMSPPNLVEMQPIVPELLQDDATPESVTHTALKLLQPEARQQMLADYQKMRQALGEPGVCDRAAHEILSLVL